MKSAQQILNQQVTEKDFLQQVAHLAELCGWTYSFTWLSIHSPGGFSDLWMIRERLVIAELKSETGQPTEAQWEWLMLLQQAGYEAYLWRPSDWHTEIVPVLQGPIYGHFSVHEWEQGRGY